MKILEFLKSKLLVVLLCVVFISAYLAKSVLNTQVGKKLLTQGLLLSKYENQELDPTIPVDLGVPESSESIAVDISGAVKSPGVYRLATDSRISDLLAKSGGVLGSAATMYVSKNINLAQKLRDEDKVYIPFIWDINPRTLPNGSVSSPVLNSTETQVEDFLLQDAVVCSCPTGVATSTSGGSSSLSSTAQFGSKTQAPGLININSATQEELESLPRIGEVTATKIIQQRPFTDLYDLVTKLKLSVSTQDQIKPLITF